ncbi:16S rRNA processing protein RimM [Helicobacter sp. 12S02634-8]|uniref:ribosome maturation factor RimM n=1 Tax=Helicobacter sp. 12S02634-8 TaxID=1476199 RepID=UPI000BA5F26F|nr:ribosome maturation factor RimM [Helicobacter sp. 12S02634-8]PAF46269.1 16S rRNA processing protein RimM [Helicobacter sp. 12S02634-8]
MKTQTTPPSLIEVGRLGKTIGLKGGLKLHLSTDFPQSIQADLKLTIQSPQKHPTFSCSYTIKSFDTKNSIVFFQEITSIEAAKPLTHHIAYTSLEDTQRLCVLQENEYFWFDVIGCVLQENGQTLGIITDIERIGASDYLIIKTAQALIAQGLPKTFMLPYIDHFILQTSPEKKCVIAQGARAILEAS